MGTVKLALVAIDTHTKQPVINAGYTLARADQRHWEVLGLGGLQSGSVQQELVAKTGEDNSAAAAVLTRTPPISVTREALCLLDRAGGSLSSAPKSRAVSSRRTLRHA